MGINTIAEQSLISKLRRYLLQKRYVVIFDDAWKLDFWEDIKYDLIDNNKGDRIMNTTHNMR